MAVWPCWLPTEKREEPKIKEPDLARYYTVRDRPEHQRLFRAIRAVLRGVRQEVFYPNPGWQCQDCPFFKACLLRPRPS